MLGKPRPNKASTALPHAWCGTVFAAWLALAGAGFAASTLTAAAQSANGAPAIEIPAEIKVAPAVLTPLRIKITGGAMAKQTMIMVRGIPPRVMLSEGRSFAPGVWMIPLANLGTLEIAPATGTSGKAEITVELIALDGKVLAEAQSTLTIAPAVGEAPRTDALSLTVGPLPGGAPLTGAVTQDEATRLSKLVEKGDASMQSGKIAAARLFYQSAAENGSAPAALALGGTYDSAELSRSNVVGGIKPDPALARKWYEKARELGSPEATRRLQQLRAAK
jgi:TPR repeat protein